MQVLSKLTEVLKEAENIIKKALREDIDNDPEGALEKFTLAMNMLESIDCSDESLLCKRRLSMLSYVMLRVNEALVRLGKSELHQSVAMLEKALHMAEASGDAVQIARCKFALGIRYGSHNMISEALNNVREAHDIIKDRIDREAMITKGWALVAEAYFDLTQGQIDESLTVINSAIKVLEKAGNFAGLSQAYDVKARIYIKRGSSENAERSLKMADEYREKARKVKQIT